MAAPSASSGSFSSKDDEVIPTGQMDPSSWRLRDMSYRLLYHRYGPDNEAVPKFYHAATSMTFSKQFDEKACVERIRLDRGAIARSAFDAAATAVLEAVEKAIKQHVKKQRRKSLTTFQQDDLPPFLSQWLKLEELCVASKERALNNKDYAKRPLVAATKKAATTTSTAADGTSTADAGAAAPASDAPEKAAIKKEPTTATKTKTATTSTAAASAATSTAAAEKEKDTSTPGIRQFTRNTPASSAEAMDARYTNSRAILCTAGNVCFDALTPPMPGFEIEVTKIPQNTPTASINMGNVVVEAQTLGQRAIAVAVNANRRAALRYQYRKNNIQFGQEQKWGTKSFFRMKNRFQMTSVASSAASSSDEDEALFYSEETQIPHQPAPDAVTEIWEEHCLPRFLDILKTGSHALYHDVDWWKRHGRIANLFQVMAREQGNYGTHLIITTEPEVERFAQEFQPVNHHVTLLGNVNPERLRALAYTGDKQQRRKLRRFFSKGTGLVDSPYHVMITSYSVFLEDYFHFCQTPFESVVLDDGASWMATARGDPNSPIGTFWDSAIWSKKDHVGLAGTAFKAWDFTVDEISAEALKGAWIGLTARNRIMTSSITEAPSRNNVMETLSVSGLVDFLSPHFSNTVREEWDRSKIFTDAASMEHFRNLLTRSTIVYHPDGNQQDIRALAMDALNGRLPAPDRSRDPLVPDVIADETFVDDGKVAFSRRGALVWLGEPERSWLRYELGSVPFKPILDVLNRTPSFGHCCEEIVPASFTTSSGSSGQITGNLSYRSAVRCNRHFGSEQGLRQHLSAVHAPPGTWLCRTCGTDCITSQSRTHHERNCGQDAVGCPGDPKTKKDSGQGPRQNFGPAGVVGKKKGQTKTQKANVMPEEKDADGSFRVPGYRGVWVNPKGKHFVKIKGKKLTVSGSDETLYFDSIDDAAKGHDSAIKDDGSDPKAELNFKDDGTRIVYEDVTTSTTTGLGGSANNVVPALSIINIKDLPADVKPLLRDPRQTSRTGGNSKRHVYAYRGVCRQARKGHDRWQSQISFMGVNHYLGTFDSEWDAAAIYSWAHLILYGEEATRKAQKEGEEAAAAYEQEKKDIAAGKTVPQQPPPPEKKQKRAKRKKDGKDEKNPEKDGGEGAPPKKRKRRTSKSADADASAPPKKKASGAKKMDINLNQILPKGASRAWCLAPRDRYVKMNNATLLGQAVERIIPAQQSRFRLSDPNQPPTVDDLLRPCNPSAGRKKFEGAAMLLGLSAKLFDWEINTFVASRVFESPEQERDAAASLLAEYQPKGTNESFKTLLEGTLCVIGNASPSTRKAHKQLGLGKIQIGGAIGEIDCNIGGTMMSCSETAATIRYAPTTAGDFQFAALNDDDIVTLNGRRITPGMGSFPLFNEDICTVGARVFMFLLPKDT